MTPLVRTYSLIRSGFTNFRRGIFAAVFLAAGLWTFSSNAALVSVSNVNGANSGGYALFDQNGTILTDPPSTIFIGGFSTFSTVSAIQTAFATNFSALAADFVSIGSVGVEVDSLPGGPYVGLHDSETASGSRLIASDPEVGRNVAIWLSTTDDFTDQNAEHLIYLTSTPFDVDPVSPGPQKSYSVILAPSGDQGNGTLAVGGYNNYTTDLGLGAGFEPTFNTVAVPEPGTIGILSSLGLIGFFLAWRRRQLIRRSAS